MKRQKQYKLANIFYIINTRKKIRTMMTHSAIQIRMNGIFFGLYLSSIITASTYLRFEKLFGKIEKKQIISLRKI